MKSKILISVVVFFGFTVALAAIAWQSLSDNRTSVLHAQPSNAAIVSQYEKSSDYPSSPAAETPLNASTGLKVTHGGLTVEIREYDLNPDYPTVTICADLPSVADWLPRFSASYNGETIGVWQVMLIDPQNTAYLEKNRCYLAMLPEGVFDKNHPSGILIFSLDYFEMSLPEKLPADIIKKAKEKIKVSGIEFEVQDASHSQNLVITKKPDSTSQEEAWQVVQKAIEDLTDKVYGPWVFTIDLD